MNNDPASLATSPDPLPSQPTPAPASASSSQLASATAAPGQPNLASGWRTTEFWMTALSHVGLLLASSSGVLPPQYAAIAIAASQVAYNFSRGMAKQNAAPASLLAAR